MIQLINIKGKQYPIKFTNKSLHYLEVGWGESYLNKLMTYTPSVQSNILFYSMIINFEEFENETIESTASLIQDCLENNDFTLEEFYVKVGKAHNDSIIVKQLFKQVEASPSDSEGLRAFDNGRGGLYGLVRRVRDICTRFLVKHAKGV